MIAGGQTEAHAQLSSTIMSRLAIPSAHDFCVISACTSVRAYKKIRDFPQTKLDSEIKAPFLLNEHSDPHLFY